MKTYIYKEITIEVINANQDRDQERESGMQVRNASQERDPRISPRLRAAAGLRFAALGGFGPSQARPQQARFEGAALMALAEGSHRQALGWAALVMSVPLGCWRGRQDTGWGLIQAPG